MTGTLRLIASAGFGVEAVVARELKALGYADAKSAEPGRVRFEASPSAIARCNIRLRSADRVFIEYGRFDATDFGQLFDQTRELPWETLVPPDAHIHVRGRSTRSTLHSVPACQRLVKKAIVDRLMDKHAVQTLPETGVTFPVEVSVLDDHVSVTIDTSGRALHRRGYRPITGEAPLKETLAAAIVQLSFWKGDRLFLDPFCGTGTIVIEAALYGRNIAPGLRRDFIAESWETLDPLDAKTWKSAREEAQDLETPRLDEVVHGADVADAALESARFHATNAGVEKDSRFLSRRFEDTPEISGYGCLITNPPYGHRLGETKDVRELYGRFPMVLARLANWSHYIFTAEQSFESLVGKPADRRRKLYSGPIACTLYQYYGPRPGREAEPSSTSFPPAPPAKTPAARKSDAVQPVFGGIDETTKQQAELFEARLIKRARHFRKWPERRNTDCYRVYDRDIKEIPLIVERFGDSYHVSEIVFSKRRSVADHAAWVETMLRCVCRVMEVPRAQVFFKRKHRQRGDTQHEKQSEKVTSRVVQENGLKFLVNLSDYVDTGLFLDHRTTRERVRRESEGVRFLNLFAYTGSFTVYSAAGGAHATVSVDRSRHYLDRAEENLSLNQLKGEHRFVATDVESFLSNSTDERYDLAVVDPPTFSNRQGVEEDWLVQRDHPELLRRVLARMSPGGIVYFSTNFRQFKLASELDADNVEELTPRSIPEDFRNRRVHRCWRIVR